MSTSDTVTPTPHINHKDQTSDRNHHDLPRAGRLKVKAITFEDACAFIQKYHSHHRPPQGWKFGTSVTDGKQIHGVITVGRPVARLFDDGVTLEVTRCCTDGTSNVASKLYAAARRAAAALGYSRLITYTLLEEHGRSLVAAGWQRIVERPGRTWNREARPRSDNHPTGPKVLWRIDL